MSKTENAKKSRGKRTPSAEERLKDAIASCEERHRHWHELYENGTSDPFWADGVNLNLVHNHIRYYNKIIKECCDELGQDYGYLLYPIQNRRRLSVCGKGSSKGQEHY